MSYQGRITPTGWSTLRTLATGGSPTCGERTRIRLVSRGLVMRDGDTLILTEAGRALLAKQGVPGKVGHLDHVATPTNATTVTSACAKHPNVAFIKGRCPVCAYFAGRARTSQATP